MGEADTIHWMVIYLAISTLHEQTDIKRNVEDMKLMTYYYVEIIVYLITIRFLKVYVDVQNVQLETKRFSIHDHHLTPN